MASMRYRSIYLAGKISKGDWRETLLDTSVVNNSGFGGLAAQGECGTDYLLDPTFTWPVLPHAVLGVLDYTGPYFIRCDHGCYHGPGSHGIGASGVYWAERILEWEDAPADVIHGPRPVPMLEVVKRPAQNDVARARTQRLCRQAIDRADLVFAWITRADCHGTLLEIGYALGRGKQVWIAGPQVVHDLWLTYEAVQRCALDMPDPRTALLTLLHMPQG